MKVIYPDHALISSNHSKCLMSHILYDMIYFSPYRLTLFSNDIYLLMFNTCANRLAPAFVR